MSSTTSTTSDVFDEIVEGIDLPASSPAVQLAMLLGLPVDDLDIAGATDAVAAWDALVHRCEAGRARVVAHLARLHGGATPSHDGPLEDAPAAQRRPWEKAVLGTRLGIGDGPARSLVATAVALDERLPALARALADGGVTWQHCAAVAHETEELSADDAGRVERRILADRRQLTAHQYRLRAHALARELLAADPEVVAPPVSLRAWNNGSGGVDVAGSFTADGGRVVGTAVDVLAARPVPGDDRPVDVRRADALVQICADWLGGRTAEPADPAPRRRARRAAAAVTLHVGPDQLRGADDVEVRGGAGLGAGFVTAETARRLTCDGLLAAAVHDADGRIVALSEPCRFPADPLRRLVEARDRGCRWPGCRRSAPTCDAHHVVHHADGGPTAAGNLLLLCPWHHHCAHEGRHRLRFDGATLTVIDPQGRRVVAPAPYAREPEPEPWVDDVRPAAEPRPDGETGIPAFDVPRRARALRRRIASEAAADAADDLRDPVTGSRHRRATADHDEPPPF